MWTGGEKTRFAGYKIVLDLQGVFDVVVLAEGDTIGVLVMSVHF